MVDHPERIVRPTEYTPDIGRTICGRLVEDETLREICRDPRMPAKPTVMQWLTQHEQFRKDCELVRKTQLDDFFCESMAMLDETVGRVEKVRRNGTVIMVSDRDKLASAVLLSDVRWWVADRLLPHPHYALGKNERS